MDAESRVAFYKVDTDKAPDVAQKYGIQAIPTMLRFKTGKQDGQSVGFQPEAAVRSFATT